MHQFTPLLVTVPASTPQASPVTVAWPVYPGWLAYVIIEIPAGHNGLTGIRVTYQQTPVIPFNLTSWLVGSGQRFTVPWEDEVMAQGLRVQAYNTDAWPHSFYLYADIDPYLAQYKGQLAPGGPPLEPAGRVPSPIAVLAAAGPGG